MKVVLAIAGIFASAMVTAAIGARLTARAARCAPQQKPDGVMALRRPPVLVALCVTVMVFVVLMGILVETSVLPDPGEKVRPGLTLLILGLLVGYGIKTVMLICERVVVRTREGQIACRSALGGRSFAVSSVTRVLLVDDTNAFIHDSGIGLYDADGRRLTKIVATWQGTDWFLEWLFVTQPHLVSERVDRNSMQRLPRRLRAGAFGLRTTRE